jgi:Ala-tRNA(Pro) deacylase
MVVLPASHQIDLGELAKALGGRDVRLVDEAELTDLFPECERGAMPPFGNLYGMPVLCDAALAADEEIFFNAGTHTEIVGLSFADYRRLVTPQIAKFAKHL